MWIFFLDESEFVTRKLTIVYNITGEMFWAEIRGRNESKSNGRKSSSNKIRVYDVFAVCEVRCCQTDPELELRIDNHGISVGVKTVSFCYRLLVDVH